MHTALVLVVVLLLGAASLGSTRAFADENLAPAPAASPVLTLGSGNGLKASRSTGADLVVSNTVTGNMGSRDQYFKFTIYLDYVDIPVIELDRSQHDLDISGNPATRYLDQHIYDANNYDVDNNSSNGYQVVADSSGEALIEVYLQHGEALTIRNLPASVSYTVTEDNEPGYTTTVNDGTGGNATQLATGRTYTGQIGQDGASIAFVNRSHAAIPTEVRTPSLASVLLLPLALAALVLLARRTYRHTRYEEGGLEQ